MNNLKNYFPMIRTKQEILSEIQNSDDLSAIYDSWTPEQQNHFLSFCSGEKGISILTDGFIKEIFNPEYAPERMEDFLSLLLHQPVRIRSVLPNDSARIAGESYLIITDIVIELYDGSIANLEIQRLGYMFPGQRSACYSADLLLRQYRRVRSRKQKRFSYKNIQNVYTIVLYEKSPSEFHAFPNDYVHYLEAVSDTGIKIDLLQKYIFVPLDIFQKNLHNNGIRNRLEAWLAFLSSDSPEIILPLLKDYPSFQKLYEELYTLCQNTGKVMNMFSEELAILDRNTEQYMMDEMQAEIDRMKTEKTQIKAEISQMRAEKDEMCAEYRKIRAEYDEMCTENDEMRAEYRKICAEYDEMRTENDEMRAKKDEMRAEYRKIRAEYDEMRAENDEMRAKNNEMRAENDKIRSQNDEILAENDKIRAELAARDKMIADLKRQLASRD